jgi:phosphoglycolate phosphatase
LEKLDLVKNLVIFDLDGTLVDSTDQICRAVYMTREKFNYGQVSKEFLVSKIGLAASELFLDLNLSDTESIKAVETLRKYLSILKLSELDLFPSVNELLNFLKSKNFSLAIGTNKPYWLADKTLKECKIRENFSFISGGGSLPLKPDKAILENCLKHFSAPAASAIMIGDRVEDMRAAASARVAACGILQGVHDKYQLFEAGAKEVFLDITDFYESLVKGWDFEDL